jgi:2-aminoadipate transaminase
MNFETLLSQNSRNLQPSVIRGILKLVQQGDVISFAGGTPDAALFDRDLIARLSDKVVKEQGTLALQYGETIGWKPLREQVVAYLSSKGIACSLENVVITAGSQQGLDLASHALINPGDGVVVEEPTFLAALLTFRKYGARFLSVPVGEEGLSPAALDEALARHAGPKPKFLYTIPTFQNPAGSTMPLAARQALLEVCKKHDLVVLEDDPYGELNYTQEVFPPLKSMDSDGRVIHLGSFSKIGMPGMRLGWACADAALVARMVMAKETIDVSAAVLTQAIAAEFFKGGHMEKQVATYRRVYAQRRDVMLEEVQRHFPNNTLVNKPKGGFFLWVKAPGVNTFDLFPKAVERKVAYVVGGPFFAAEGKGLDCMRLAFCAAPDEKIREGIKNLGALLKEAQA